MIEKYEVEEIYQKAVDYVEVGHGRIKDGRLKSGLMASATIATKPGGWAWVITIDGKFHCEGSGHLEKATNNDAELLASIWD